LIAGTAVGRRKHQGMDWFDDEQRVQDYVEMSRGSDGSALVALVQRHVARGQRVLELGMGPGFDLDRLLDAGFVAVGSDRAVGFLKHYRERGGAAPCFVLDAVSMECDERFDAVYSNKVLHHLETVDLIESLRRQVEIVGDGGVLVHSFWRGDKVEEHHGMLFNYWDRAGLEALLPARLRIVESERYSEIWEDDSLAVVFSVQGPAEDGA
jgi:trans-aconitate methyltransferase